MLIKKCNKVLLLILLNILPNLTTQWIIKDPASLGALSKRAESLSKLLKNIVHNYFSDCVLIILYDDTFINQQSGTIDKIFNSLPEVSYIQKKVNLTLNKSIKIDLDKCYSYLIFLNDIYNIGKIINKETINKVVIITESTPWIVKEFLKSYPSRSYTNLLIITHSMSRRTEASLFCQKKKSKIILISVQKKSTIREEKKLPHLNKNKKKNYDFILMWIKKFDCIELKFDNLYLITLLQAGSYLLYTHRLYVDGSGTSQPVLLTSWIKDNTTKIRVNLFPEKLSGGFKGHRLLISTAHKPPYTIRTYIHI